LLNKISFILISSSNYLPVENVGLLGNGSCKSDLYLLGSLVSNKTIEPSHYWKECRFYYKNKLFYLHIQQINKP